MTLASLSLIASGVYVLNRRYSAALWATSRDGDWRKPARAALWLMARSGTISRNERRGGGDELVINPLLLAVAAWSSMGNR